MDLHNREIFILRNVIFQENIFPNVAHQISSYPQPTDLSYMDYSPTSPTLDFSSPTPSSQSILPSSAHSSQPTRMSTRSRRPPTYLQDYHCSLMSSADTNHLSKGSYQAYASSFRGSASRYSY
ncbi:uncharacterized protein LOC131174485 [Hevea brasiliensis]|uniref:uncharacterized protein LOC131174485 n=1 Tax=Hevea brasiliensis TaxID=3981 RepID=UPI0025F63F6E|nr:uncharacterized protein LOC131174485 [Hevea brasiliensis]